MAQATVVIGDIRLCVVDGGFDGEKHWHYLEFYDVSDDASKLAQYAQAYSSENYNDCQDQVLTAFTSVIMADNPDLPENMMKALGELSITDAAQWLPGSEGMKQDHPQPEAA